MGYKFNIPSFNGFKISDKQWKKIRRTLPMAFISTVMMVSFLTTPFINIFAGILLFFIIWDMFWRTDRG